MLPGHLAAADSCVSGVHCNGTVDAYCTQATHIASAVKFTISTPEKWPLKMNFGNGIICCSPVPILLFRPVLGTKLNMMMTDYLYGPISLEIVSCRLVSVALSSSVPRPGRKSKERG